MSLPPTRESLHKIADIYEQLANQAARGETIHDKSRDFLLDHYIKEFC